MIQKTLDTEGTSSALQTLSLIEVGLQAMSRRANATLDQTAAVWHQTQVGHILEHGVG